MKLVFQQYGKYIVATIATAAVLWAMTKVLGLWNNPYAHGEALNGSGLFGKLVCLWLNRVM